MPVQVEACAPVGDLSDASQGLSVSTEPARFDLKPEAALEAAFETLPGGEQLTLRVVGGPGSQEADVGIGQGVPQ